MSQRFRTAEALVARVESDATLQEEVKKDPVKALRSIAEPLASDVWVYRIVVLALGLAVLIALIATSVLVGLSKPAPEGVIAIGSAAAGALAGLLAPSPVNH